MKNYRVTIEGGFLNRSWDVYELRRTLADRYIEQGHADTRWGARRAARKVIKRDRDGVIEWRLIS